MQKTAAAIPGCSFVSSIIESNCTEVGRLNKNLKG